MSSVLFCYTLLVMLIVLIGSAVCFSCFLVSTDKAYLYFSGTFVAYFFDVALVFLDDFNRAAQIYDYWIIGNPIFSIITFFVVFLTFDKAVGYCFGKSNKIAEYLPVVIWAVVSLLILLFLKDGPVKTFIFYQPRAVFIYALLFFVLVCYLNQDNGPFKSRLKSFRWVWVGVLILNTGCVVEDINLTLLFPPQPDSQIYLLSERNIFENLLFVLLAVSSIRFSARILKLHRDTIDFDDASESMGMVYRQNVLLFTEKFGLTNRESEILGQIIRRKDNQNISNELCISLSTVKVHISNILKKSNCANRKELISRFWES